MPSVMVWTPPIYLPGGKGLIVDGKFNTAAEDCCCYTGGLYAVWKFKLSADLQTWAKQWGYYIPNSVRIASNTSGRLAVAAARYNSKSVWVFDASGTVLWSYDTGASTYDVAIADDGTVYVAGIKVSHKNVWALSSEGSLLWSYEADTVLPATAFGITLVDGYLYVCTNYPSNNSLHKIATDGTGVWGLNTGTPESKCMVGSDGTIFVVGTAPSGVFLQVYDSDRTLLWSASGGSGTGVALTSTGNVIATTYRGANGKTVHAYDPDGAPLWNYDTVNEALGVSIDADDNAYCSTQASYTSPYKAHVFDSDGNLVYRLPGAGTQYLTGIAVGPSGTLYASGYPVDDS